MDKRDDFLRLFLKNQDDLRAVIGSLVRDAHAREDIFQEAALVLWRKFDEYDPARSFGAWARGVAVKKVMQSFDRNRRLPVFCEPEVIESILSAYDETEPEAGPEAEALRTCIGKLPEKSRRLLALRYEESLKLRELAGRLHSTLDAVHKALSRLRIALRRCIERELAAS